MEGLRVLAQRAGDLGLLPLGVGGGLGLKPRGVASAGASASRGARSQGFSPTASDLGGTRAWHFSPPSGFCRGLRHPGLGLQLKGAASAGAQGLGSFCQG